MWGPKKKEPVQAQQLQTRSTLGSAAITPSTYCPRNMCPTLTLGRLDNVWPFLLDMRCWRQWLLLRGLHPDALHRGPYTFEKLVPGKQCRF
eukprot:1169335-Amphidinium_carterae.1